MCSQSRLGEEPRKHVRYIFIIHKYMLVNRIIQQDLVCSALLINVSFDHRQLLIGPVISLSLSACMSACLIPVLTLIQLSYIILPDYTIFPTILSQKFKIGINVVILSSTSILKQERWISTKIQDYNKIQKKGNNCRR